MNLPVDFAYLNSIYAGEQNKTFKSVFSYSHGELVNSHEED